MVGSKIKLQFTIHEFDILLSFISDLKWDERIMAEVFSQLRWPVDQSSNGMDQSPEYDDISVIFVEEDYIQQLNTDYRQKAEPTDVLSFEADDQTGEVYICPSYIAVKLSEEGIGGTIALMEEILRMAIHGTLHLLGHDHEGYFDWKQNNEVLEEMYQVQEELLSGVMKELDS